jgi:hypothetical protein
MMRVANGAASEVERLPMLAPDAISALPSEAAAALEAALRPPVSVGNPLATAPWEHPLGRNASQNSRSEGWDGLEPATRRIMSPEPG